MKNNLNKPLFKITNRLEIEDKIPGSIDEFTKDTAKYILKITKLNNLDENEKTIKCLEYALEKIYFNKDKRKKAFDEIVNKQYEKIFDKKGEKKYATPEEITKFLEKNHNMLISGKDWKKLISTGINNWSYGQDGSNIKDRIDILSTISYYSLQATLRTGIHTGLFLQNIGKFFPHLKSNLFEEFKENPNLCGGLALTELTSGSDLLSDFDTTYEENEDGTFTISGTKHLQGLTNEATHWIILAKNKRKYKLFLIDTREKNQNVEMIEEYEMRGLNSITYGINKISAIVPAENIAQIIIDKDLSGLKTFVSMLYDSRLQFPAMMVGAMQRLYDETMYKTSLTKIGKFSNTSTGFMLDYSSPNKGLEMMKLRHSIIDFINKYLIFKKINLQENNSEYENLSIIAKTVSTEYILKSGEVAKNLQGGFGFKKSNVVSNIIDDAWPFSRFEGVNEMLYSQLYNNLKSNNIEHYIDDYDYNKYFKSKKNIGVSLSKIKDLQFGDDLKGQLYSRLELVKMMKEMNVENKYHEEMDFLKKEIQSIVLNIRNINCSI